MEQINHISSEQDSEYAINLEAKPEAFISALEDIDITDTTGDLISLNTSLSPQTVMYSAQADDNGYISSDTGYYETRTKYVIDPYFTDLLYLSADQIKKIEDLATAGDVNGLKNYFNELIQSLNKLLSSGSYTQAIRDKIRNTINILQQCSGLDYNTLLTVFFKPNGSYQVWVDTTPKTPPPNPEIDPNEYELKVTYIIDSYFIERMYLSDEQRKRIEELASAGDMTGLRNYLQALSDNFKKLLSTGSYTQSIRDKISNTINIIGQCLSMDDTTLLSAFFQRHEEYVLKGSNQNPLELIGIIIDQDVTECLIALYYDENFYEQFFALLISEEYRYRMFLTSDQEAELSRLITKGNDDDLKSYLTTLIAELKSMQKQYEHSSDIQNQDNLRRITYTISIMEQLQNLDIETILNKTDVFKQVETPFLIMRSDKIDEYRERIMIKANLQKLLTMIVQAKGDSYNAILQIMTQQSGYQKMNLEKLNDKQIESLNNYSNTRTREIADFVNKHNETEKAKIEKEQAEKREREYGNVFLKLAAGIFSLIISIVAAIFSAGIAVPLIVSVISTCVNIVATARQTQSDIEIKKELEKTEEYLTLLRATEQKYETEHLRKKKEELEKLQKEAEANSEYYKLLDLEIMQLNTTMQNTALSYSKGWLQFDNTRYLQNVLRVQALINAMRIYSVLQKEKHESRNRIAAELSLPGAYVGSGGETVVNSRATALLEKMNKLGELELELAEANNRRKTISEEIKQNRMRMGFDIVGSVVFTFVNLFTFGTGGPMLAGVLSSTGEAVYGMYSKYLLMINTSYNPNKPANFNNTPARQSQEDFNSLYADLLSQSSDLSRNLTANKKALDYDKYLRLLKEIEIKQIKENLVNSINAAEKNSRGIIHQEMTDNRSRGQDAFVKIASQQTHSLLQDVVQKQAYLTNIQNQTINQQVDQRTEIANAGFNILVSAATGVLAGQAVRAGADKKTTEAFLYGMGSGILSNGSKDIFDLIIGDSDLKLRTENQDYSSSTFSGSFENMLASDRQGNYTVNQNALLRNYAKLQRQVLLEQALIMVHSAKQKARDVIHMEIAEKSAQPVDTAKAIGHIQRESLLNRWGVFVEQAYTAAEQLSLKENRRTEVQRNFLVNLTSAAISGAAFAGGLPADQANAVQKLTYLSLQLAVTAYALHDTSLDIANRVDAGQFTQGELAEELGLNRLSAAEQELLNEAMELKTNSGKYGFQAADKGYLEYLNVLLERLQKIKEIIMRINSAMNESRHNVHAVLDPAAAESEELANDCVRQHSRFLRQLIQSIKKGDNEIVKRRNQRNNKKFEMQMQLFTGTYSALDSLSQFMQEGTSRDTLRIITQNLQGFLPLLQAGLLHAQRGSQSTPSTQPDLSGLTKAEQASVLSAYATADLELTQAPLELWKKTIDLTEQGITALSKLTSQKLTAQMTAKRLEQLLQNNRLAEIRTKTAEQEKLEDEQRRKITELFNSLKTSDYYSTHILPALELYNSGRTAEALNKLNERCTENFFSGVVLTSAELNAIRALQTGLKDLSEIQTARAAAQTELHRQEAAVQAESKDFQKNLDYIRQHNVDFAKAQEEYLTAGEKLQNYQAEIIALFPDGNYYGNLHRYLISNVDEANTLEQKVSPEAAEQLRILRTYTEKYQAMSKAVLAISPIFADEAAYKALLGEMASTVSYYGAESYLLFNSLLIAQNFYGSFVSNYAQSKSLSENFADIAPLLAETISSQTEKPEEIQQFMLNTAIQAAVLRDIEIVLPEDPGKTFLRQREISAQAVNISSTHHYTETKGDTEQLWRDYFVQRAQKADKLQEIGHVDVQQARTEWQTAQDDLQTITQLFDQTGLTQEIDIAASGISANAVDYIQTLYGRGAISYQSEMRNRVLEYLSRKADNRAIMLLNSEADLEFAENLLTSEWEDIKKTQARYEHLLQQYLQNPNAQDLEALEKLKSDLERKERAYQQKQNQFLIQQKKGIIQ